MAKARSRVRRRQFVKLIFVVLLLAGLAVAIYAVQKSQEAKRSEAAGPENCDYVKYPNIICVDPTDKRQRIGTKTCFDKTVGRNIECCQNGIESTANNTITCKSLSSSNNFCVPGSPADCINNDIIKECTDLTLKATVCSSRCPNCVCVLGAKGAECKPTVGTGTKKPTPTPIAQTTCTGSCLKAGDFGLTTPPQNCGSWGKDLADGSCSNGGFCCRDRADFRPPPVVSQIGASGGGTLTVSGNPKYVIVKPTVILRYSKLSIRISQEEIRTGIWSYLKGLASGYLYTALPKDAAKELGFGSGKSAGWVDICNDTNPDYNINSCDKHEFKVPVYGLNTGKAKVNIQVSAYDSVNNTTGFNTGSVTYTVNAAPQ